MIRYDIAPTMCGDVVAATALAGTRAKAASFRMEPQANHQPVCVPIDRSPDAAEIAD
jgi:hypothetical protein